jgi:hypothetical protein
MFGVQVVEVIEFTVVGDSNKTQTKHVFETHKPLTTERIGKESQIIVKESPEAAVKSCSRKSIKGKQVKQPPGRITVNEQTL